MNQEKPISPLDTSLWYQNAMFYGIDVRRFQDSNGDGFGDFQGLISRLGQGKVRSADGERVTVDLPGYGYLWMQT